MSMNTDQIPEGEALEAALAKAYLVYQGNVRRTEQLIHSLTKGAREGVPERELLDMALDYLSAGLDCPSFGKSPFVA